MPIYKTDKKRDGLTRYEVTVNYTYQGKSRAVHRIAYGLTEAKELEAKLTEEYKNTIPTSRMTVEDLINEYLDVKKNEIRQSTYREVCSQLSNHVLPFFKDVKLKDLTPKLLQEWKNKMYDTGSKPKTLQHHYSYFCGLLNYAVNMDYMSSNPLKKLGNFRVAEFETPEQKIRYYTADEFKKYIACAKQYAEAADTIQEYGYYVFFAIAFYCGLRKGENNALKWSDISDNVLTVRRSVSLKIKGQHCVETPPKNKSSCRSIDIPAPLAKILAEHKERQKKLPGFTEDFRVCGAYDILPDTSIEVRNKRYSEMAGLEHRTIHEFRHSHATVLINNGIMIQEIARRLGHSDIIQTAQTYAHLYPKESERALNVLNNI